MSTEVNLFEVRASVGEPRKASISEVARFKDEAASGSSKVIADAQRFVVYSLKNPSQIRVLVKTEVPPFQVIYKNHTSAIRSVKFVSDLSNIAASASEKELNVWYVDQDAPTGDKKTFSIHTYFSAPINALSLSWIPLRDKPPNLLVLFRIAPEDAAPCNAAILKSSDLIVRSSPTDPITKVAKQPDGLLTAGEEDYDFLAKNIPATGRLTAAASPTLAFSFDASTIITCTLANRTTPKWKPCNGENLVDMALLPTETLIAASEQSIFLWDVAGEPRPLQHLKLLALAPCTFVKALSWGFIAGFKRGAQSEVGCFKLPPRLPATAVSFFSVPSQSVLTAAGVCATDKGDSQTVLLADLGGVISYAGMDCRAGFQAPIAGASVPAAPTTNRSPRLAAQAAPGVPAPRSQQAAAAAAAAAPSYVGAVTGGMAPPPYAAAVSPQMVPVAAAARAAPPPFPMASFLPGGFAQAPPPPLPVAQQPALVARPPSVAQSVEPLRQALEESINTAQAVLNAAQQIILNDHENGVRASLETAVEVMKNAASEGVRAAVSGGAAASVGSSRNPTEAFDAAIVQLFPPLSRSLVDSVSAGIEEYVNSQLEGIVRGAMTKQQKKVKPLPDLRDKVDVIVRDAMSAAIEELKKRENQFNSKLLHYIYDLSSESTTALQEMQRVIQEQQKQLDAIVTSGLLEEVERLREEVATLKARQSSAAAAAASAPARMTPETVLANAQQLINNGHYDDGLQFVLRSDDAPTLHKLLFGLDDDVREALTVDKAVSDATWTRVVYELTASPNVDTLASSTSWLTDLLIARPKLLTNATLAERINTYLASWKSAGTTLSQKDRDSLRQLSLAVRR